MNTREPVVTGSPEATRRLARRFGAGLKRGDCVALCGPMGAGKTLFVQGLAEGLKAKEPVTSPTFSLMNRYNAAFPVYHFDLYRCSSEREFDDLGWDEYFHADGVTAVEWADKFIRFFPPPFWRVVIEIFTEKKRRISFEFVTSNPAAAP